MRLSRSHWKWFCLCVVFGYLNFCRASASYQLEWPIPVVVYRHFRSKISQIIKTKIYVRWSVCDCASQNDASASSCTHHTHTHTSKLALIIYDYYVQCSYCSTTYRPTIPISIYTHTHHFIVRRSKRRRRQTEKRMRSSSVH